MFLQLQSLAVLSGINISEDKWLFVIGEGRHCMFATSTCSAVEVSSFHTLEKMRV